MFRTLLLSFISVALSLPMVAHAGLKISSEAPGNLFVAGTAPVLKIASDPAAEVAVEVTSYWDQTVHTQSIAATPAGANLSLPPLEPGFYTVKATAGDQTASASLGVVMDRGNAPLDAKGRVCVDAAAAWLNPPEQWRPLAKMVRIAGIPWVRERLSWGQVEPAPGKYEWGKYDTVADAYKAEGVNVYQIFHDSPAWAQEKRPDTRNVADLRHAYAFTKTAAAHFAGRIQAWEVWNEPDIGFWTDLGDRFAGIQKSCYLGLKAGDPRVSVLEGSFCRGLCRFDESLQEQGLPQYYDVFNWHIYAPPSAYAGVLKSYLELLTTHKAATRPVWLSEAGIRLMGTEGPRNSLLNMSDQRLQAQFVAPSVAMSLIAGTDRHFLFVLPHYLENGVQFGLLKPDLTPYPGFLALSACANIISSGEYIGQLPLADKTVEARGFATPRGLVLMLWAPKETAVTIPCKASRVTVADVFGHGEATAPVDGGLTIKVGPETTYIIGLDNSLRSKVTGKVRKPGVLPVNKPAKVVLVGSADLPADKARDLYLIKVGETIDYTVGVYNFDEKNAAKGTVNITVPSGWTVSPATAPVTLAPMGRHVLRFRVCAVNPQRSLQKVTAQGRFDGTAVAPAVSAFSVDVTTLKPTAEKPLALNVAAWKTGISGNGKATQSNGENGEYVLSAHFGDIGDRWCYSTLEFDKLQDFSAFNGVSFDVRCTPEDTNSRVRFQIGTPSGAHYLTSEGVTAKSEWQRAIFMFDDMGWGSYSPVDPNGKLKLDKIALVQVGFNTAKDDMKIEVRNFKLVKMP